MKIGIVISDPDSGILFYPTITAIEFKNKGHEVCVFTHTLKKEQINGLLIRLIDNSIKVLIIDDLSKKFNFISYIKGNFIKNKLHPKRIITNIDLLLTYGPSGISSVLNSIADKPKVISFIEAMGHDKRSELKQYLGSLYLNLYCDIVYALCHLEKQRLLKYGVLKKKLEIIYNPVSVDYILEILSADVEKFIFLKKYKLPEKKIILYAASFQKRKCQDLLIKAYSKLDSIKNDYIIVFAGEGEELENCKTIALQTNTANHFFFLGKIPYNELILLMKFTDFVVHCSNADTFGYSMIEPLILKKPLLTTKIGIGYELSQHNFVVGIKADSLEELEFGLKSMILESPITEEISLQAYHYVLNNFNVKTITDNVIDSVLKKFTNIDRY